MKETTIKLHDDKYLQAYREIIGRWGYSSIEDFMQEHIQTLVKSTLNDNWDSLSKDIKESKKIARRIAKKYGIPLEL